MCLDYLDRDREYSIYCAAPILWRNTYAVVITITVVIGPFSSVPLDAPHNQILSHLNEYQNFGSRHVSFLDTEAPHTKVFQMNAYIMVRE